MTLIPLPCGALLAEMLENDCADLSSLRTAMLNARRQAIPTALRVRLDAPAELDTRLAACELIQYADLLIIDRATAALLGTANEKPHPDLAAALARKLMKRFGLGGVMLPDEGYARLNSAAAQLIYPAVAARLNNSTK